MRRVSPYFQPVWHYFDVAAAEFQYNIGSHDWTRQNRHAPYMSTWLPHGRSNNACLSILPYKVAKHHMPSRAMSSLDQHWLDGPDCHESGHTTPHKRRPGKWDDWGAAMVPMMHMLHIPYIGRQGTVAERGRASGYNRSKTRASNPSWKT